MYKIYAEQTGILYGVKYIAGYELIGTVADINEAENIVYRMASEDGINAYWEEETF